MPASLAHGLVLLGAAYLLMGVLWLPWWWLRGLNRLDTAAARSSWTVRLWWMPGLVALWPFLIRRGWRGDGRPPPETNAHRRAARPILAP